MNELSSQTFGHEGKSASELEVRRREIIAEINLYPKQVEDPDVPLDLLRELAFVTSSLRRRTSGPAKPTKAAKPAKPTAKVSVDTLGDLIS